MKIGLLPFYLELYDRMRPENRLPLEKFYNDVAADLHRRGADVITAPICRIAPEFRRAVRMMESSGADAIVTLHLAYSPSLESAAALAASKLPIIVLDTTPDWDFGPCRNPAAIMRNHGIHGVQDMCNLLIRYGKQFAVEAGHWRKSDVLDRIITHVQSAALAGRMRRARVGRIGPSFKGMGDFCVPENVMRAKLGLTVVSAKPESMREIARKISDVDLARELAVNRKCFQVASSAQPAHRRSAHAGLTVRHWLEREKLTAFSVNFLAVGKSSVLPVMPFLEASLAMGRGIGYAGEGDVLTAGLMGAVVGVYPDTTFTEMFCPDWRGERIFFSHMGEWNVQLASRKPKLMEYDFVFGTAENPVRPVGCLRSGAATLVNLAPLPDEKFRLIITTGRMDAPRGKDAFADTVHGWFKPAIPLNDLLADYSRAGGTHHSVLVYGGRADVLTGFGRWMGWEVVVI